MHNKIVTLALATAPSLALAHPGHGGMGLFHHAADLLPWVVAIAVAAIGWWCLSKR
ncbi:hypothetical protein [Ferrimonas senticii]|uniref:hypothetical protein n=1 Tax=Ferrimonas senticii TaxID=394566 RepID=UPI00040C0020|nr:hypothetical protein [Ferrimonas senticii]